MGKGVLNIGWMCLLCTLNNQPSTICCLLSVNYYPVHIYRELNCNTPLLWGREWIYYILNKDKRAWAGPCGAHFAKFCPILLYYQGSIFMLNVIFHLQAGLSLIFFGAISSFRHVHNYVDYNKSLLKPNWTQLFAFKMQNSLSDRVMDIQNEFSK